jgi:hypothetical protein
MKKILFCTTLFASTVAMAAQEDTYVLKSVNGISISQLADMQAQALYPLSPQTAGNIICVIDGNLQVGRQDIYREEEIEEGYSRLNTEISGCLMVETNLEATMGTIRHNEASCIGRTGISLNATVDFNARNTLYSSDGDIHFSSPAFAFSKCFFNVNPEVSIIYFAPPSDIHCGIEHIQIKPRKGHIFVDGHVDFKKLDFVDFFVSHSDVSIKFRN